MGEVISIAVGQGDAITGADKGAAKEATELLFVADLDQVIITTAVTPPGSRVGATVSFRAPSMPDKIFQGKVTWVAHDGSQLRSTMENQFRNLSLGLGGTLFIEQDDVPGLYLPRTALLSGGPHVLVRRGNAPDGQARFVETRVTMGFDGGGGDITVTGLSPNVEVAADASAVTSKAGDAAR